VGLVAAGLGDDGSAEVPEQLRDGDGDEPECAGAAVAGTLEGGGDGEEGIGEQADRGPAVPGGPGGDLAAVEPGGLFSQLVVFLDFPAGDGHGDQLRQRDRLRAPAQEVADGAGVPVPPQEQCRVPGLVSFGGVVGRDLDHRPVVVLGALGRLPGAHPLPHAGFHQAGGVLHGGTAAGRQGDAVVRADGHHVAGAALADAHAQVKAAVHLVAGDEPGADAAVMGVLEQAAGQFRLRGEHDVLGHSGQFAALLIGGPVRGQVQDPAHQCVPGRGSAGQGNRDLAHGDPAEGAAVLPGRSRAVRR
jgi:hypothetical protein